VRATANAAEACASAAAERFDVVLSDVRVPGGGGMSVLARCRETQPGTPVILMTGFDEPGGRERALAGGATAYLVKPIPLARLLEVLRGALASRS
jgi:two-component system nitrogen regulation response regulator GlnG